MNILVVGLGVIGTTYGHLFQKAGHNVEHLLRQGSSKSHVKSLRVDILDGRFSETGARWTSTYDVKTRTRTAFDLVFVSVPSGAVEAVVKDLETTGITGTLLVCCGIWEDQEFLEKALGGRPYVLGYPVAGGSIQFGDEGSLELPKTDATAQPSTQQHETPEGAPEGVLSCCAFDHFMLEGKEKAAIPDYDAIANLFADCGIELECPHDMREWIWLHMAVNAAVVSVAGRHGDVADTSASAERLMDSEDLLDEAVRAIRETAKIVRSRGVDLRNYRNELAPYRAPLAVSAPVMKRMFATNELTRRIMTLHGNVADLLFVCRSLYEAGKGAGIEAPVFYTSCEAIFIEASEHVQARTFETPSGSIRYWTDSSAGAEAPWLVFLPGLTADHTLFNAQMAHFSGKANCLVWDAPAHGKSRPFAIDFTLDDLARMLNAILGAEGIRSPVLVGQSMGGYIAQTFIDLFPGKAAGFVSVDSSTLKRSYYPDWEVAFLRHTKAMYLSIPWKLLKSWGSAGAARSAEGRANMRSFMDGYAKREFCNLAAHGYHILADALDARRSYDIDCPVLLLCGEKDDAGDVRAFNRKWAAGEGIPLVWVPKAGHNSNVDESDFVNSQIERFLATIYSASQNRDVQLTD